MLRNSSKLILSIVLAILVTLCFYRAYFKYDLELSMDARSMGKPAPVSILSHSPQKPKQWTTLLPESGATYVGADFQRLTFHIPARKIDSIHILFGKNPSSMELRNIQFSDKKVSLSIKDLWTPDPPVVEISEKEDGVMSIRPLSLEQPRIILDGAKLAVKGISSIDWLSALSIFGASFLIVFDLLTLLKKRNQQTPLSSSPPLLASRRKKTGVHLLFWGTIILLACVLHTVTSYSWPGCDEYWSATCGYEHKIAIKEPWEAYVTAYINWNQRLGNCIQFFVITAGKSYFDILNPLFLLLSLLAIIKLATNKISTNSRGIILFLFSFSLLICGVPSPKQTLFLACPTCIYTWVSVCWLLFLSIMINGSPLANNHTKSKLVKTLAICAAAFLGFCSGMSNECVIGTLILFIGGFILIKWKTIKLFQWVSIAGFILGAIVFFTAPALTARAAGHGTVPVNLTNIPYLDRLEYWPMLMHDLFFYSKFIWRILTALGCIVFILAIIKRNERREILTSLLKSIVFLAGAVTMSSSYLAGAVPYSFAHLPSTLLLICACVTMIDTIYAQLRSGKWIALCVICLVLAATSKHIVTAVTFGKMAHPYLISREATINEARKSNSIPVLEELPFTNQDNPYIWIEDLKDPSVKKQAAVYYKVKNIKLVNDPPHDP